MTLTEQYAKRGFCVLPSSAIDRKFIDDARKGMSAVRDGIFDTVSPPSSHPGFDHTKLCKINDAHLANHALYTMLVDSRLGESIANVTGSKMVQVWASQLLIKPPRSGNLGRVGWHQDRQYWQFWQKSEGLFTAWIALSDVSEESGPIQFVPGSHRWGFLGKGDFFSSNQDTLRTSIQTMVDENWKETSVPLSVGGVSLHHCLTYHGSQENISDKPRWSFAVHLRDERAEPIRSTNNYYISHLEDMEYSPVIFQ